MNRHAFSLSLLLVFGSAAILSAQPDQSNQNTKTAAPAVITTGIPARDAFNVVITALRSGTWPKSGYGDALAKLSAYDVIDYIEAHSTDGGWDTEESDPGTETQRADKRVQLGLIRILIERYPARVADHDRLTPEMKLALAEYYRSINDAKCVAFYEELLAAMPAPSEHGFVKPLRRLSYYYVATNQMDKAGACLERAPLYSTQGWFISSMSIQAGRYYLAAGEYDKAIPMYDRATKYDPDGWESGIALCDRYGYLMSKGKTEEARKMLMSPHTGARANEIQVVLDDELGNSYFESQDFEKARFYFDKAVTGYEALKDGSPGTGADGLVNAARRYRQMIDSWKVKPFALPLDRLVAKKNDDGTYFARLFVHSLIPQPVTIVFDNTVQLIACKQKDQRRAESGVLVTTYEISYRTTAHPVDLDAQVQTVAEPHYSQPFVLHLPPDN